MKKTITKYSTVLLALAGSLVAVPAKADNPYYAPGDLVLAFQNPGGSTGADQTIYVDLGNAATIYRGAAAGADVSSLLNIVNINSQLATAFGAGWYNQTTLFAGLAGVYSSSTSLTAVNNGDVARTLYVSQGRTAEGTIGQANSDGWTVNTNTGMTSAANGIIAQNNIFDTTYNTQVAISPIGTSTIDDYNPFLSPGLQGTAFNALAGGVQQQGGSGVWSSSFGGVSNVEFALDLYRIAPVATATGAVDGLQRQGTYEGTVVVDQTGNVSYISAAAVPEPSTYALFTGALGAFGFFRRFRRK